MDPKDLFDWAMRLLHYLPQTWVYVLCASLSVLGAIMAVKAVKAAAKKLGVFVDRLNVTMDKIDAGLERGAKTAKTVDAIHSIQGKQAENHLHTIEIATVATKEETIKTNAKLDVLIDIMSRRA